MNGGESGAGPRRALEAFSTPVAGRERQRQRLTHLVHTTAASVIVSDFVDAFAADLDTRGEGLPTALVRWPLVASPTWWSPALVAVAASLTGEDVDPVHAAVELLVDPDTGRSAGAWAAQLRAPSSVRIGRRVVPDVVEVHCPGGAGDAPVETGRVAVTPPRPAEQLRTVPTPGGSNCVVVGRRHLRPGCRLPDHVAPLVVEQVKAPFIERLSDAVTLLEAASPAHRRWVTDVIDEVVAIGTGPLGDGDAMFSGSNEAWPGLIYLSSAEPEVLAENLVHEASHQYFSLATRVGAVVLDGCTAQHWSPFVQRLRPLEAIASTFHAFGNSRIFLDLLDGHPLVDQRWLDARRHELDAKLAVVRQPLEDGGELSELGRALLAPLQEALGPR